ncbi:MAG: hypothetical protein LBK77_05170 [Spirochaetaceae bacterium]|jgi:hypothetical protein|nr:hypothetical protein [Spirochaetaceae bacterium]
MKTALKICAFILVIEMLGCASSASYNSLAREKSFDYFFPSDDFAKTFSTIDEAYEFVSAASIKFSQNVSTKRRNKGLAARLRGPAINDSPVTLVCLIRASDINGAIDLSAVPKELDVTLRRSEDALLFFCVFYGDRAISLSNFYLDPKYSGYSNGNAQVQKFGILGNTYEADYPIGWGIEKAFSYLRGEIN